MGQTAALDGITAAANAAINGAGVQNPGQCGVGQGPQAQALVNIFQATDPVTGTINPNNYQWQVTAFALPGGDSTPYAPEELLQTTLPITLIATVVANVCTLTGSITAGVPVHIGIDSGRIDVAHVCTGTDTFATILADLAGQVNALAVPGVSAASGSSSLTVTGATSFDAIVASQGMIVFEVGRVSQKLQLSIWSPNDTIRSLIEDAIISGVGTSLQHSFLCADGTTTDCMLAGPATWNDQSQGRSSLYVSHVCFLCEYPITRAFSAVQIAAGQVVATNADGSTNSIQFTFGG